MSTKYLITMVEEYYGLTRITFLSHNIRFS